MGVRIPYQILPDSRHELRRSMVEIICQRQSPSTTCVRRPTYVPTYSERGSRVVAQECGARRLRAGRVHGASDGDALDQGAAAAGDLGRQLAGPHEHAGAATVAFSHTCR